LSRSLVRNRRRNQVMTMGPRTAAAMRAAPPPGRTKTPGRTELRRMPRPKRPRTATIPRTETTDRMETTEAPHRPVGRQLTRVGALRPTPHREVPATIPATPIRQLRTTARRAAVQTLQAPQTEAATFRALAARFCTPR